MTLQQAQKDFGKYVSISGTVEQLSKDFKQLNFREFNKKYATKFRSNNSLRGTERRIVGEFVKNQLPAGKILQKSYQKAKIKTKGKQKKKKKTQKVINKYGKQTGNIRTKRKGIQKEWKYPSNVWDVNLQNFNSNYPNCKRQILRLKNAFDYSPTGLQQVLIRAKIEYNDNKKKLVGIDWITFRSGVSFSVQLIDLLANCEKQFNNYLKNLKKHQSSKNSRLLEVRIIVLRYAH